MTYIFSVKSRRSNFSAFVEAHRALMHSPHDHGSYRKQAYFHSFLSGAVRNVNSSTPISAIYIYSCAERGYWPRPCSPPPLDPSLIFDFGAHMCV